MPVRKKVAPQPGKINMVEINTDNDSKLSGCCKPKIGAQHCSCKTFGHALIKVLGGILLVYLIFYIGTLINNNLKENRYIGLAPKQERTINVAGYGKIDAGNDIAVTTLGYSNTSTDVATAQSNNKKVMDAILSELKKMSIDEKDIKSSYSIYPQYNYGSTSGRTFDGYQVNHKLTVKIRVLSKIQNVLALAGKYGANQVNGLSFTIDDTDSLKSQARVKALTDARKKAQVIASYLGVTLGKAISYSEYESSKGGYYPVMSSMSEGLGGSSTPDVSSGSSDMEMNVNVVYEIK